MRELPTGTVTFLFTDIEGSTRLLHEHGERYAELLAEHRRALRDAFAQHGGVEVDTQGDAFFVAFSRASDALAAAREAQTSLRGPIRVRIGVHTGEPAVTDEGYVGIDVHRAARIAAAGHGGQVLVSRSTRDLVPADGLHDLGEHRLKDLTAPERIYQLGDGDFPPLKTLHATNLPVPLTPFLGRDAELGEVRELLQRRDVRLLSLTGSGGSGKTRLALQAAAAIAEDYPQGVWWVPLASITDAVAVLPSASRVFGSGPLAETIGDRRMLLLLDNFEHVMGAATDLPPLLAACPRLDVLVTSRERLRVQGEHVYAVEALARPDARALFVTRAQASAPRFRPDEHVDELCARLDDLPLAIELAAARSSVLTTEQLLDRLGGRLDLLKGGRDADARQRTLRATIEWSYELLTPDEQRLLTALSVFRGGWTLDAAERVCDADLDVLESLADKSLIRRWEAERFGMLETIREFCAELLPAGERDALSARLLQHLIELGEEGNLSEEAVGVQQPELMQAEDGNIETALAWALDAGEIERGLELIWRLELHFPTRDPVGGQRWIELFLEHADERVDARLRARVVRVLGATYDMSARSHLAEREYVRARELFLEAGDDEAAAHLLGRIAVSALQESDFERAAGLAADALEHSRKRSDRADEAIALNVLGSVALHRGDLGEGSRLMYESAALAEEAGFVWWRGVTLGNLAEHLVAAGELDEGEHALLASVEVIEAADDRVNTPFAFGTAVRLAAARGEPLRAGVLWGAIEALEERGPTPAWTRSRGEFEASTRVVAGDEFERGRAQGRMLTVAEAFDYIRRGSSPSPT